MLRSVLWRSAWCAVALAPFIVNASHAQPAAAPAGGAGPATQPAAVATVAPSAAAPAAVAGGTVSGRVVTATDGKAVPDVVVFLESADPNRKFDVPPKVVRVSQRNARFNPSLVVVAAGQSVDFANDELRPIEHNVFSRSPAKAFDLGLYKPGATDKVVKFDTPGPVRLFCSIHRYMDGTVYVCPNPYFALAGPDGTYRIDGVPPGEYRVRTWQRAARFEDQTVPLAVTAGGQHVVELKMGRK